MQGISDIPAKQMRSQPYHSHTWTCWQRWVGQGGKGTSLSTFAHSRSKCHIWKIPVYPCSAIFAKQFQACNEEKEKER
jgi:hypothetical protein